MITQQVAAYLEQCFTMPVLPATVLMLLILAYGCLVMLGAMDVELFDLDLDIDLDADLDVGSISNLGLMTLKFLNLADVPVMIWVSLFGLVWWVLSQLLWMTWDLSSIDPNTNLFVVRNAAASVFLTKFLTNPLAKGFAKPKTYRADKLVGLECEITTHEATADFGQAKFHTNAAPLILDVRATEGDLSKGNLAKIVDYDPGKRIHYVVAVSDPP